MLLLRTQMTRLQRFQWQWERGRLARRPPPPWPPCAWPGWLRGASSTPQAGERPQPPRPPQPRHPHLPLQQQRETMNPQRNPFSSPHAHWGACPVRGHLHRPLRLVDATTHLPLFDHLVSRRPLSHNRDHLDRRRDSALPYRDRASVGLLPDTARDLAGHPPCRTGRDPALVNGDCGCDCDFEVSHPYLLESQGRNRLVRGRHRAKGLEDRPLQAPACRAQ